MTGDEIAALAQRCERQGAMKQDGLDKKIMILHLQETLKLAANALYQVRALVEQN